MSDRLNPDGVINPADFASANPGHLVPANPVHIVPVNPGPSAPNPIVSAVRMAPVVPNPADLNLNVPNQLEDVGNQIDIDIALDLELERLEKRRRIVQLQRELAALECVAVVEPPGRRLDFKDVRHAISDGQWR